MSSLDDYGWQAGRTILVTGGTGTFGSALVKKLLELSPAPEKVLVYSRDEFKQMQMMGEIGIKYNEGDVRFLIGDVRDLSRLKRAMCGVDYVVHTAALKQIPLCEYNPDEAVKTNILGTMNVVEAAAAAGVDKVILLSSDKAVNPINTYGATKLAAEKICIAANAYLHNSSNGGMSTKFSAVRYGNVIGSRGSVIESFQKQIVKDGCLQVTDERMTRFWWTVDEAVDFVLRMMTEVRGGEIFIPKLKSCELSCILSRYENQFTTIRNMGIRPGEKHHEWLISPDEMGRAYDLSWCYVIYPDNWGYFTTYRHSNAEALAAFIVYCSSNSSLWMEEEELERYFGWVIN